MLKIRIISKQLPQTLGPLKPFVAAVIKVTSR